MKTTKSKFIRIPEDAFEALMRAGQMCSNVCFNLAQQQTQHESDRASMDASRKAWDAAASRARQLT